MDRFNASDSAKLTGAIIATAPTLIYVYDLLDGRNIYISPQIEQLLGYSPIEIEQFGTELLASLCHPDELDRIKEHHAAVLSAPTSGPFEITYRMRHRNGSWKWLVSREMPFAFDADGNITQIVGSALDVTELKESEERLAAALRSGNLGVHEFDITSGRIQWDQRTREIWGVDPQDPINYEVFESGIHPDDRQRVRDAVTAAMTPGTGGRYLAEFRVVSRKDGSVRWIAADANVTFIGDKPVRFVGLVHDVTDRYLMQKAVEEQITEQKRAAEAIKESEFRYRTLFDRAAVGLAEVATDGSWLRVNQALCDMLGYLPEEFLKLTWQDVTHPDDIGDDLDLFNACLRGEIDTYRLAKRYIRKTGDVVFAHLTVTCLRRSNGTIEYFLPIVEDVTATRSAERALQASEARYKAVVQDQTEMLCRYRNDGTLILVNQAYALAHGTTPSSMEGHSFYDFLPPLHANRVRTVVASLNKGRPSITSLYRVKRGEAGWRWEEWVNRVIVLTDDFVYQATGRDVTDQLTAENQLRQSRERLRLAARAASLTYMSHDLVSASIARLDNFKDVMGFDIPDGTPLATADALFLANVHPEDRDGVLAHLEAVRRGVGPHQLEYRVSGPSGVRWLESRSHAERGKNEKVQRIFVVTTDVTMRKTTELQLEFATRELMHRSKNLFSIIQGIASISARSNQSMQEFLASFSKRIEALSRSEDLLVHGTSRGIEISALIRDQLSIAVGADDRASLKGPPLELNPNAAQALGLALHELATNSIKHGALSRTDGRLEIHWMTSEDEFAFSWQELNGPPVRQPERRGFGRTILERVAPSKLGGIAQLSFVESGVHWTLAVPLHLVR